MLPFCTLADSCNSQCCDLIGQCARCGRGFTVLGSAFELGPHVTDIDGTTVLGRVWCLENIIFGFNNSGFLIFVSLTQGPPTERAGLGVMAVHMGEHVLMQCCCVH